MQQLCSLQTYLKKYIKNLSKLNDRKFNFAYAYHRFLPGIYIILDEHIYKKREKNFKLKFGYLQANP